MIKRSITPARLVATSAAAGALIQEAQDAESAGRREVARDRFESVLYLLASTEGGMASTILRRIASSYIDDGDYAAAIDCASAAEGVSEALGDLSGVAYANNLKASAHLQRGDHAIAQLEYERASQLAAEVGDERLLALASQNLGVIAAGRGDVDAAFEHFAASMRRYERMQLDEYLPALLNNVGMAYAQFERWDESEAAFEDALRKATAFGDEPTTLMVRVNRIGLRLRRGDVDGAAAECEDVVQAAREAHDARALGDAQRHQAVIARERGRLADAERMLAGIRDGAMKRQDLRLAADALREQGAIYELEARPRDALQVLATSHALFARVGALAELPPIESRLRAAAVRWVEQLEPRWEPAAGHAGRVAALTLRLAGVVGYVDLPPVWLELAALLHDVGKVVGPANAAADRHAVASVDLLRDIEFPDEMLRIVRGHHERWDGSGSPDGLAAEDIPLGARILAVADAFDRLTAGAPIASRGSTARAVEAIREGAGRRFDPTVAAEVAVLVDSPPTTTSEGMGEVVVTPAGAVAAVTG